MQTPGSKKNRKLLRGLAFEELQLLPFAPIEQLTVASHLATIRIIVQALANGSIRVVVQGFMKAR